MFTFNLFEPFQFAFARLLGIQLWRPNELCEQNFKTLWQNW